MKLKKIIKEIKEEYVIWGVPPGKRDEEILYTKAKSMSEANRIRKVLESKYNCTKTRVQTIDLSAEFDLGKEFTRAIK